MGADRLAALVLVFAPLSLVSLGGGPSIFAEMQRQAVDVHGWMSGPQFVDLFAISRAAPGPGSLIAALVGWQAAGFAGALVAALALYVPSSLLVCAAGLWWRRGGDSVLRKAVERGLAPIAVGLIFAGVLSLMRADGAGLLEAITTLACAAVLYATRVSPYVVMLVVALVYAALFAAGLGQG